MGWFYNPPPQPPQLVPTPVGVVPFGNSPPTPIGADQLLDEIRSTWPVEQWGTQTAGISASWLAIPNSGVGPPQRTVVALQAALRSVWPEPDWPSQSIKGVGGTTATVFSPYVPFPIEQTVQNLRLTWPAEAWSAQTAAPVGVQFSFSPTLFLQAPPGALFAQIRATWPQENWSAQKSAPFGGLLALPQLPLPFTNVAPFTAIRSTWPEPDWRTQYQFGQAAWIPQVVTAVPSPPPHGELKLWAPEQWPAQAGPRLAAGFATAPSAFPYQNVALLLSLRLTWPAESWSAQSAVLGAAMSSLFAPIPFDVKVRPRAVSLWPQPDWAAQRAPGITFTFPVLVPPVPYFPEYAAGVALWPRESWSAQSAAPFASAIAGPLPPQPGFRVRCITSGTYGGVYYQPGDVFDLVFASDYSDSTLNYAGIGAGTQQFGWMLRVPAATPLYSSEESAGWIYPIIDPVPPKRFVY